MAFKGVIPAAKLEPTPYGLFNAAGVTERGRQDEHWGQGFAAMTEACSFDASIVDVCAAIDPVEVVTADGDRFVQVRPFGVVAFDRCSAIGFSVEDRKARVVRQLELVTEKAIEREFWSGLYRSQWDTEMGANEIPLGYLSHADTDVVEAGAQKPHVAVALLEQAFANCGSGVRPTLHVSPLVAEMLGDHLTEDDGKLYTHTGNLVAVGQGYDGSGPGQVAPADKFTHWLYITGPVAVVLGSKELITVSEAQAIDAKTNEMTFAAERPAAVYADGCCQFAAKADVRL